MTLERRFSTSRVSPDLSVYWEDDFVATVELRRPPDNFLDAELIRAVANTFERLDEDPRCRAIVLCSEGKHFCAGARFVDQKGGGQQESGRDIYREAVRLFATTKPVVAAVQGAAIGGGLGLALVADFRVASREARFSANFARLGFHHGFGLTVTLPEVIGTQRALEMLYTGRRVGGDEALGFGLCDRLVERSTLRPQARWLASDIASSAPLAVQSIRTTMRGSLHEHVRDALVRELAEQDRLRETRDFQEGVRAMARRRRPRFQGS